MLLAAHYYEFRNETSLSDGCMPFGVSSLIERYKIMRIYGGGRDETAAPEQAPDPGKPCAACRTMRVDLSKVWPPLGVLWAEWPHVRAARRFRQAAVVSGALRHRRAGCAVRIRTAASRAAV